MANVLLADDVDSITTLLSYFLRKANHQVKIAKDGKTAVQMASEEAFDVFIFDVNLPQIKGPEAYRKICQIDKKDIPVIYFSGSHTDISIVGNLTIFMLKPGDTELLVRLVGVLAPDKK